MGHKKVEANQAARNSRFLEPGNPMIKVNGDTADAGPVSDTASHSKEKRKEQEEIFQSPDIISIVVSCKSPC
jgi:hypothetical protein